MNARVKYLICGVVFLISVGLGFFLTRYARTNVAEDELSETDSVAVNDTVPLVGEGLEVPLRLWLQRRYQDVRQSV